ncbi:hypothetical protein B0O80DRAFT_272918 [Mortierella sp. GBAus27b]|nr:hypothetical protein B0O80DRAFT_272918 [Mortierella sp. GBAus27b]
MGQLKLFCVASDGRSLYGVSTGTNLEDSASKDPLVILVKSNADPPSLALITWSVVSTVRISSIYDITQSQNQQSCVVDDKGVFTFIGQNVIKTPSTSGVRAGVQYSPSFPANSGSTGTGGWKTIDIPSTYNWPDSTYDVFFSISNGQGGNTVVHGHNGTTAGVQFGILDATSMQMTQGPSWTMDPGTYGQMSKILYRSNALFFMTTGALVGGGTNLTMFSVPLATSTVPAAFPTTAMTGYNIQSVATFYDAKTCYSGFVVTTFYVLCDSFAQSLATMDLSGGKMSPYIRLSQGMPVGQLNAFQPIGGYNGDSAFALVQVTNSSSASPSLSAVTLQGGEVGRWQQVSYQFNVTDNVGYGAPTPNSSGSSKASTGVIVGCVLAVLVLLAAAGYYFGYYRRVVLKKRRDQEQQQAAKNGSGQQDSTNVGGLGGPGGLGGSGVLAPPTGLGGLGNGSNVSLGGLPESKLLVTANGLDTVNLSKRAYDPKLDGGPAGMSLPMSHPHSVSAPVGMSFATTTGSPLRNAYSDNVYPLPPRPTQPTQQQQQQQPQHQMHQFRLTSHPRPNFVTTVTPNNPANSSTSDLSSSTVSALSTLPTTPTTPTTPTSFALRSARPSVLPLPQIPTATRPKNPLNPHSLLTSGTLSLGPSSPQDMTSQPMSGPQTPGSTVQSTNIPWEPQHVVHNPHTDPISSGQDRIFL